MSSIEVTAAASLSSSNASLATPRACATFVNKKSSQNLTSKSENFQQKKPGRDKPKDFENFLC